MSSIQLQSATVKETTDAMFVSIRLTAEHAGCSSFPNNALITGAVIKGLADIGDFSQKHKINIANRDSIKIFAFAIPHLEQEFTKLREIGSFDLDCATLYKACINFIATTYKSSIDLTKMPDKNSTCRILAELGASGNGIAAYAYIKGLHEACLAASRTLTL